MGPFINILSTAIGVLARAQGPSAKAMGGGAVGGILMGFEPVIGMFRKGLVEGVGPSVEELGYAVGAMLAGWVFGRVTVWLTPANAAKTV